MARTPSTRTLPDTPAARRTPKSKKAIGGRDPAQPRRQKTRSDRRGSRARSRATPESAGMAGSENGLVLSVGF
jgi:hypothetical protein